MMAAQRMAPARCEMKVLFVAFEFPPTATAGVYRSAKFVKYLPEFGILPIVVTIDESSARDELQWPLDASLLETLPTEVVVERVPCMRRSSTSRLSEWLRAVRLQSEPVAEWWEPALRERLPRLLAQHEPEIIYVSLPPFSMASLWSKVSGEYRLPVVFDFRDAWSQWQIAPYMSKLHYRSTVEAESRCLTSAARVVCSSEQIRQDLLSLHTSISADKIVTITNGYDAEISDWSILPRLDRTASGFVIGYVGHFYYTPSARQAMMSPWWKKPPHRMLQYASRKEDWLYRSPYYFFRAVARLLQLRPQLRQRMCVRFAGDQPDWLAEQVAEFGLTDIVEFHGRLDHAQVVASQAACDCLLLTSSKVINGRDYSIAGKTYEYFASRKPILGFVTDGAQKDMLQRSGMAVICDPDRPETAAQQLSDLIDGRITLRPDSEFLSSLHRRQLSRQLADVLVSARSVNA